MVKGITNNRGTSYMAFAVMLLASLVVLPPQMLAQYTLPVQPTPDPQITRHDASTRSVNIGDTVNFTFGLDLDALDPVPTNAVQIDGLTHTISTGLIIDPNSLMLSRYDSGGNIITNAVGLSVVDNIIQFDPTVNTIDVSNVGGTDDLTISYSAKVVSTPIGLGSLSSKLKLDLVGQGFYESAAILTFQADPAFECAEVMGKVFEDVDGDGYQDKGEVGLPGAQLINTRGYVITTDEHGRYHLPCAAHPREGVGSNYILKLLTNSLPTTFEVTSENPRVIRLTQGKLSSVNFGARRGDAMPYTAVRFEIADHAFEGRSTKLRPDMTANIDELVSVLVEQPTSLVLMYTGKMPSKTRLDTLSSVIRTKFVSAGGAYDLQIAEYDGDGLVPN